MGYDLAESMQRLQKAGLRFESEDQTLKEIARMNGLSPQQVYLTIKPSLDEDHPSSPPSGTSITLEKPEIPSGLGNKTVAGVCEVYGINLEEALSKLAAKGIAANPDDKMKTLAERYGQLPLDLYEIMK